MINIEPMNEQDAGRVAEQIAAAFETKVSREFAPEVRKHIKAQFAGIFKRVYLRNDGYIGHKGMERTIVGQKYEQALSKKADRK